MIDLENIKDPKFIKDLSVKELEELCAQIRTFLIENVSATGGHLSSNLGVVEITVALYYVFDPEETDFLFDVGHQSYVHKILTGRAKDFKNLRQYGGISGFMSRSESEYDRWESGHSSTSISAASGMMLSSGRKEIVVIGDSAISNGVAFEGLNFLGQYQNRKNPPIIILNDNKMGISRSVGALSKSFYHLRSTKGIRNFKAFLHKIFPKWFCRFLHRIKKSIKGLIQADNIFEDLGFDYYGPYYGNDLKTLIRVFRAIKDDKDPIVLHLYTKKGFGYKYSEEDPDGTFHGVGPFDVETGKPKFKDDSLISYSEAVSNYLTEKRKTDEFFVVTPAMKSGAKLKRFAESYPESFIDVGIAEEHAAVMCAGMALKGKTPVLLMYSTFAQRAYDEILNDIARSNLHVIIGIDRAGIVGEDGVTHQGLYDVSMFMEMPNTIVTMGRNIQECVGLFNYAFTVRQPIVIRYPRASEKRQDIDYSYVKDLSWVKIHEGTKAVLLGYGDDIERIKNIAEANEIDAEVVDAVSLKPMDEAMLHEIMKKNVPVLVFEQTVADGTLYHNVLEFKERNHYSSEVIRHSFTPDTLIPHGKKEEVYSHYDLSDENLKDFIQKYVK